MGACTFCARSARAFREASVPSVNGSISPSLMSARLHRSWMSWRESNFPIYSGNHNGKWTACSDCHTNSSNYAVFTCIACHQHSNQTQVTSDHQGIKNFTRSEEHTSELQ